MMLDRLGALLSRARGKLDATRELVELCDRNEGQDDRIGFTDAANVIDELVSDAAETLGEIHDEMQHEADQASLAAKAEADMARVMGGAELA
ncbi:MAG: hypothetical protein H6886_07480 [Hyphomicrobiaceae bacterium]|nr:hypothetical protein [Hyphomicrobiaceae bacterium]